MYYRLHVRTCTCTYRHMRFVAGGEGGEDGVPVSRAGVPLSSHAPPPPPPSTVLQAGCDSTPYAQAHCRRQHQRTISHQLISTTHTASIIHCTNNVTKLSHSEVVTTCIVNFSCHDQFGSRLGVCTYYAVYAGTGYSKCLIWWVRPVERVCSHA